MMPSSLRSTRITWAICLAGAALLVAARVAAELAPGESAPRGPRAGTVEGRLVDLVAWLGAPGDGAADEGAWRARLEAGAAAALVTLDGEVYVVTAVEDRARAPDLPRLAGRWLRVSGTVDERSDIRTVRIGDLEPIARPRPRRAEGSGFVRWRPPEPR